MGELLPLHNRSYLRKNFEIVLRCSEEGSEIQYGRSEETYLCSIRQCGGRKREGRRTLTPPSAPILNLEHPPQK